MAEYKPKKKIMRKIKMNEISAVDKPAQEGALAVIMKRHDISKSQIKAVLTAPDDSGHSHIVYLEDNIGTTSYAQDSNDYGHSHPYVVNTDGTIRIAEANNHTHEVDSGELAAMLHTIAMAEIYESDSEEVYNSYKSAAKHSAEDRKQFAKSGEAMKDGSFPIRQESDIILALNAIEKVNNKQEVAHHIALRASALGMTKTENLLKSFLNLPALDKSVAKSEDKPMAESNKPADTGADVLSKRIEQLEKSLKTSEAFGKLTDVEKAFYAGLDDKAKEQFLAKSDSERKAEVELSKAENAVVYTSDDGVEFRKNDDPRLVAMAKRADESSRELAKAREKEENAVFEKRAEAELQFMPGTVQVRAAIIKSVEGIKDEAIRKAAFDSLKAHNDKMSEAFKEKGSTVAKGVDDATDANKQLDELAKAYAKENNVSYFAAYDVVKNQNRELYKRALQGG